MSPTVAAPPRRRSRTTVVRNPRKIDRDATALAGMEHDLELERLVFNWINERVTDLEVRGAITSINVERTIEGASIVEIAINDPENKLFSGSRMWEPKVKRDKKTGRPKYQYDHYGRRLTRPDERGRAMEINLDGIIFRLVKVSKSGDDATLTFEDRIIYLLRRKRGAKRANRKKVTRAQFILSIIREIKTERIRFVCPELNVKQPIDKGTKAGKKTYEQPRQTNKNSRGLAPVSGLTVSGARATPEQRRVGERVLAVADELNANGKATLALVEACIVESGMRNLAYGHSSSVGILQLLNIHGSVAFRRDIENCVRLFLLKGFTGEGGAIALAKKNPSWSAGTVAWHVQGPAIQYRGRYDQVQREATEWVAAYGGSGADVAESGAAVTVTTRHRSYQFARQEDEDSWTAMQRLATEVGWRCYVQGRSIFYMSESDLFRRKPQYKITPDDPAVQRFDFDIDWGKTVSEARVTVVAGNWKCPPGEPIIVEGFGPPDGRWLVTSWRRDYFSPVVEVTIRQPGREKMEPAPQAVTKVNRSGDEGVGLVPGLRGDVSRAVLKAYARADAIDRKRQSYVWGGGHGSFNDSRGYDCSGFVSSCLHAAGLLDTPLATGGLIGWGQSGRGRWMTVWVHEDGNPRSSHTFMTFTIKGRTRYGEAGGAESGATGWHRPRSHAGFEPRHWPGT